MISQTKTLPGCPSPIRNGNEGTDEEEDEGEAAEEEGPRIAAKKCRGRGSVSLARLKAPGGGGDSLAVKYGVKGSIIDYTDFLCRKKP